jgi:hypothetical protein
MGANAALLSAKPSIAPRDAGSSAPEIEADPLDWLQTLLKQAMTEVMDGEGTPLQKAAAVARLGALYLRTHKTAELQKANKELTRRLNELEDRLAAAEAECLAAQHPDGKTESQPRSQAAVSSPPANASPSLPDPTHLPAEEFHTFEGPVPTGEVCALPPGSSRASP